MEFNKEMNEGEIQGSDSTALVPLESNVQPERSKELSDLIAKSSGEYVTDLWLRDQNATVDLRNRFKRYYQQYRGISSRKGYKGLANVFVNETLEAVESIVAQTFSSVFGESKPVKIMGREETDEDKAKRIEALELNALDQMGFESKLLDIIRQVVIYGTSVAKVCWKYEDVEVEPKEVEGENFFPEDLNTITRNNADLEYIDILDVAFDPGKSRVEDMDWIVVRKRVSWDYIKDRERTTLYSKEQVEKVKKGGKEASVDYIKNQKFASNGIQYENYKEDEYELLEFWGKVPVWWVDEDVDPSEERSSKRIEAVIEVVSGVTLRLERNPYKHKKKPFLKAEYIRVDNEAYGIGVPEICDGLQSELNDKRNQLLDHTSFQIFPSYIKVRAANIDENQIKFNFPGNIIDSDIAGDGGLTPMRIGGNPQENIQMDSIIKQDIRNQTGATNPVQGISSNKDTTAYEASVLERRGSSRINVFIRDFSIKFLKPCYRMIYQLQQQYVTKEMAVRIIGKNGIKWEKVTPQDLILDVDFIPNIPTDMDSRTMLRSQMIQFLQAIAPVYPRTNVSILARRIYELFGFNDVDQVVPLPDTEKGQNDITPEEEIQVLSLGQKIEVHWWDNHLEKISILIPFLQQYQQNMKPNIVEAFKNKIFQHQQYLNVLEQQAQMAQGSPGMAPQGMQGGLPMGQPPQPKNESIVSESARGFRNLTAV